jgi:hypothetical protein
LIWWENFTTMIPAGHQITWAEFKQAFKEHHIPKYLMDRKMKELLALKQGSDMVYEYAKKFNALCQYGGHHVDNDAKKIERFRDGLHGNLYKRLNLYEPNNYQDLVNKAISQEDTMSKAQRDRKRQVGFTATGGSGKKFRFIKKGTQGPLQSSSTGHWRVTPSQNKPSGNFQFCKAQQQPYKPSAPPANKTTTMLPRIVAAIIVGSPDTTPMNALSPGRTSRVKAHASVVGTKARSPWCKSSRVNSTSPPWLTSQREQQC